MAQSSEFVSAGGDLPLSGAGLENLMRAVLERHTAFRFRARGSSMYPFIRDSDIVTISPLGERIPQPGDVVAFLRMPSGRLVVHRVTTRQGIGLLAQGDGLAESDGVVSHDDVIGIVSRVERQGREVRLGLGPERRVIGALQHLGLLQSTLSIASRLQGIYRRIARGGER